jgi:hypothetical protein
MELEFAFADKVNTTRAKKFLCGASKGGGQARRLELEQGLKKR